MAYTFKQRKDKGFDFFDDNGKKITIDQYIQATGANRQGLINDFASKGDVVSRQFINTPQLSALQNRRIGEQERSVQRANAAVFNPLNIVNDIGNAAGDFARLIGAGIQQGAGRVADVALQGGNVIGELGRLSNPLIDDEKRDAQRIQQSNNTEALRNQLQSTQDILGQNIEGTSGVDENARRIATGQGSAQDIAAVAGAGLQTALDATMFANPVNLARGTAGNMTARQLANFAGKDALFYGGGQGIASGAQEYGTSGDLGKALTEGITQGAISGLTQGTLDTLGLAARGARNVPSAINQARPSVIARNDPRVTGFDDQYSQLAQQFDNTTDAAARREISKAMALNRVERSATARSIQREVGQGGYAQLPSKDEIPAVQKAQVGKLEPQTPAEQVLQNASKSSQKSSQAGTSINTNRYNVSDETKQVLTDTVDSLSKDITARTGARLGLDEVATIADETTDILRTDKTREATAKAQAAMLNARQKQALLADKVARGEGLTPNEQQEMVRLTVSINSTKADLARQLGALRIDASPRARSTIDVVLAKISKEVGDADAVAQAATKYDLTDSRQLAQFYREFVKATPEDWLDKLRYNSMLSSPLTHSRNIFANLSGAGVVAPVQKLFEGGTNAVRALINRQSRTRFAGEGASYAKNFLKGITSKEARQAFKKTLSGELGDTNVDIDELYQLPLATKGFAGQLDKVLSFTTRLTDAVDQWALEGVRRGETGALNYRQARGAVVDNIQSQAEKAAEYRLFRQKLGNDEQGYFLKAIDFIPSQVLKATQSNNPAIRIPAKLSFPFIKTPTNVAKQMIEYSPLGLATIPGSADRTAQVAKAVMGTTAVATIASTLAANDALTFALPTNPTDREKFLAEGKQPYSFKVGDKWISYQYLHPGVSFNLAAIASVNDAIRNKEVDENLGTKVIEGLAGASRFFVDQSYFKNAQDFLSNFSAEGFQNPATLAAQTAANTASQFIPFRALGTWIKNMVDPTQRRVDTSADVFNQFYQNIAKNLPWLSETVGKTYTDALGNPLQNTDILINAVSPARVRTANPSAAQGDDPLSMEINRLYQQDEGIKLGNIDSKIEFNGISTTIDPGQREQLQENINTTTRQLWEEITSDERYAKLSDEEKRKALSQAKSDVTAAMKDRFAQDYSFGQYSADYTGKESKLSSGARRIANGTLNPLAYLTNVGGDTKLPSDTPAFSFLDSASIIPKEEKSAWSRSAVAPEYKGIVDSLNNTLPEGMSVPYTNGVAEIISDFQKRKADSNWSQLQEQTELRKTAQNAFKSVLTDNEKFIAGLSDNAFLDAIESGNVTEQELANIDAVDRSLVALGGTAMLGNTLRSKLGLQRISGSSRSGGGGRSRTGFQAPKDSGFSRVASTAAIQRLLSSAGSDIRAKTG